MKVGLLENLGSIRSLVVPLIVISTFNVLPTVFPTTTSFSYVFIVCLTVYFFVNVYFTKKYKNGIEDSVIFRLMIFWTILIIIRGIEINYNFFRGIVVSPFLLLPYLIPFLIKSFTIYDFKKILLFIHYMNIIFLMFLLFFILRLGTDFMSSVGFVEDLSKYFAFPNFLLLFSLRKVNSYQKVLSIAVYIIGFLLVVYCARRSLTWTFGWAFIFALVLNVFAVRVSLSKRITYSVLILIIGLGLFVASQKYKDVLFGNLLERIDAKSRDTVISDFESDMDPVSLWVGRGISGGYTLKETDFDINDGSKTRSIIEAGYLNIVLKGGYIYLVLISLIYLIAIYRGLFKTNNTYSKAFACFVLLHLLELYPAGVLTFNFRFFLLWFCIAMCWNDRILKASDKHIRSELQLSP